MNRREFLITLGSFLAIPVVPQVSTNRSPVSYGGGDFIQGQHYIPSYLLDPIKAQIDFTELQKQFKNQVR